MPDSSVTDPEVLPFTSLLDALPDNVVGEIGASQLRSIVKSLAPRFASLSIVSLPVTWSSTPALVSVSDAANLRHLANGWQLESTGQLTYLGQVPMVVKVDLTAAMTDSSEAVVTLTATHTNAFTLANEPLFSISLDNISSSAQGSALVVVTSGSQISVSSVKTSGTLTTPTLSMSMSAEAAVLPVLDVEIRRGVYGTANAAGPIFSVVPFTSLYHITDKTATPALLVGTYGLDPATTVPVGGSYDPDGVNNVLRVKNGSPDSWSAITGDGAAELFFTTLPFDPSPVPVRPSSSLGSNGSFIAYGYPTDLTVNVWGPKVSGVWPIYPRVVSLLPATS